jgi:hypothetical protein
MSLQTVLPTTLLIEPCVQHLVKTYNFMTAVHLKPRKAIGLLVCEAPKSLIGHRTFTWCRRVERRSMKECAETALRLSNHVPNRVDRGTQWRAAKLLVQTPPR